VSLTDAIAPSPHAYIPFDTILNDGLTAIMSDRNKNVLGRTSSHHSDFGTSSTIRTRNRHLTNPGRDDDGDNIANRDTGIGGLLSAFPYNRSRSPSPLPPLDQPSPRRAASPGNLGQFFTESWNQGWNSMQDLTSTLLSTGNTQPKRSMFGEHAHTKALTSKTSDPGSSWGPAPPPQRPRLDHVAAGSLAQRHSALKTAKTASVLQSHEGVNGGLDVSGKHKRRNSDEVTASNQRPDDYLVYIHHVQSSDTYAGLILRYKCREDAFRRANGLWSRDSVQTRKWLTIPVDACEVRGRPCEDPSVHYPSGRDLLAPTPILAGIDGGQDSSSHSGDDYFKSKAIPQAAKTMDADDDKPWVHVRWVRIESIEDPVEIGRISKGALGYFPPRRKRSIRTTSTFSTPRQSIDLSSNAPGSASAPSPQRPSSLSSRPQLSGNHTPVRSRLGSDGSDGRPEWMRQPGGVGSMSRSTKAPGPNKDYLNTWTKKHIPGLNIDGPSMSIMGSETARFGFGKDTSGIVESPFERGDVAATNRQGTGLDRAAAAVETWLRGALAKRPSTPVPGNRSSVPLAPHLDSNDTGDLIELADTTSDDDRLNAETGLSLMDSISVGSSGRDNGGAAGVRGRTVTTNPKGAKTD
jgi:hypothetical protein